MVTWETAEVWRSILQQILVKKGAFLWVAWRGHGGHWAMGTTPKGFESIWICLTCRENHGKPMKTSICNG